MVLSDRPATNCAPFSDLCSYVLPGYSAVNIQPLQILPRFPVVQGSAGLLVSDPAAVFCCCRLFIALRFLCVRSCRALFSFRSAQLLTFVSRLFRVSRFQILRLCAARSDLCATGSNIDACAGQILPALYLYQVQNIIIAVFSVKLPLLSSSDSNRRFTFRIIPFADSNQRA